MLAVHVKQFDVMIVLDRTGSMCRAPTSPTPRMESSSSFSRWIRASTPWVSRSTHLRSTARLCAQLPRTQPSAMATTHDGPAGSQERAHRACTRLYVPRSASRAPMIGTIQSSHPRDRELGAQQERALPADPCVCPSRRDDDVRQRARGGEARAQGERATRRAGRDRVLHRRRGEHHAGAWSAPAADGLAPLDLEAYGTDPSNGKPLRPCQAGVAAASWAKSQDGTAIYTIGYDVAGSNGGNCGDPGYTPTSTLRQMASDPGAYYEPRSGDNLGAVFEAIARDIQKPEGQLIDDSLS